MRPVLPVALLIDAPTVVSARDLLSRPALHDGERLVIAGMVQNPRKRLPSVGNGYTSFVEQVVAGGDVLHDVVEAAFVRPILKATQPPGTPVGPP